MFYHNHMKFQIHLKQHSIGTKSFQVVVHTIYYVSLDQIIIKNRKHNIYSNLSLLPYVDNLLYEC